MGFSPVGIILILLLGVLLFFSLKFLFERIGAAVKKFTDIGVIEKNPNNKISSIPVNFSKEEDK